MPAPETALSNTATPAAPAPSTGPAACSYTVHRNPRPATDQERAAVLADPGFGVHFTDHMAHVRWTAQDGWGEPEIIPYGPIRLDPSAAVLHYGQEIFEGLKAYRHADGSIWTFRPEANGERMMRSAARLSLPAVPVPDFVEAIRRLVTIDQAWVPAGGETSLYLRPFMFGSEAFLGVRTAHVVDFYVIASPAGSYFSGGIQPVNIWITDEYTRAARGGTGAAKCGGNYASSLIAQEEAEANGCSQVCFLDAEERTYVEELGGMNLFVVTAAGELRTPALTGSILEGVTRRSILQLAAADGLTVSEDRIEMKTLLEQIAAGEVAEIFACGTAAVVTPVGSFASKDGTWRIGDGSAGQHTLGIRQALLDIQYGRAQDTHGWLTRLV